MRIAYQYKLRPTQSQMALMDTWLDLLRLPYNYRWRERLDWWEFNRCSVNACPLVCSIAPLKEQPEYYGQKRDLLKTKELFPEYQDIYSTVLQDCIGRVKKTFDRVPKTLKERWHVCDYSLSLSRDENAAINIKQRAEGHPVFKAQRLLSDSRIG